MSDTLKHNSTAILIAKVSINFFKNFPYNNNDLDFSF